MLRQCRTQRTGPSLPASRGRAVQSSLWTAAALALLRQRWRHPRGSQAARAVAAWLRDLPQLLRDVLRLLSDLVLVVEGLMEAVSPSAIPPRPGVGSEYKRLLHVLFGGQTVGAERGNGSTGTPST